MTKWATIVNWEQEDLTWRILAVISFDDSQLSSEEDVYFVRHGHFTVVCNVCDRLTDRYFDHVDFGKEFLFGSRTAAERSAVARAFTELK